MITPELDYRPLTLELVDKAKQAGATDAELDISIEEGVTVTVRNSTLESIEYHRNCVMGMVLYFGHRKAGVSVSDLSMPALEAAIQKAKAIAEFTEEDPYSELAPEALMLKHQVDLELYHPWKITTPQMIALALQCDALTRGAAHISQTEAAAVSTFQSYSASANSRGFLQHQFSAQHEMSLSLIAEAKGDMERDGYYTASRQAEYLLTPEKLAAEAIDRTVKRLNPRTIKTGKMPVLFFHEVARSLFGHLVAAISGGNLYRQASFLCDRLGHSIFPANIQIHEQPLIRGGLASSAYDQDAVATYAKHFVRNGILENYVLGHYAAKKLGMTTTANAGGVFNLFVEDHGGGV